MAYKGRVNVRMGRNWIETTEQIRPITQDDRKKLHLGNMALANLVVKEISSKDGDKLLLVEDEK